MSRIRIYRTNRKVGLSPYLTACKEQDGLLGNIEMNHVTNVGDYFGDFHVDPGSNLKRGNLSKIMGQGGDAVTLFYGIADELSKPGVFARLADILKRK